MNYQNSENKKNLPDFIYVGTGKAGTTWLFSVLSLHPGLFLAPTKETNFFDLNYHRGLNWYSEFFRKADAGQKVGEIAHRYMRNSGTAQLIKDSLKEDIRILVGLREPSDYALSNYLFVRRNGETQASINDYLVNEFDREAISYRKLIEPYFDLFGSERVHICDFHELQTEPQIYLDRITDFLEVDRFPLGEDSLKVINPARKARHPWFSGLVSRSSKWIKRRGGQRTIQFIKSRKTVNALLFQEIDQKPIIAEKLKREFENEVKDDLEWIDISFGTNLANSWYSTNG